MKKYLFATLPVAVAAIVSLMAGCSSLSVKTDPDGATVVWSRDGIEPFRPWPPNSWELRASGDNPATPFRTSGFFGDSLFVTVEKEGYLRPLPQLVQLHGFRRERLEFDLLETPEAHAARMRSQGFLYYRGQWVDPTVTGVTEYKGVVMKKEDAFRLEQLDKGLVEYEGKWYTPTEAVAIEERDRIAAGYVRYKDRWVQPEVAEREKRIDEEVTAIAETKPYADLPIPKFVSRSSIPETQVQLYNSSPQQVRFLFSGPVSKEFLVEPYRSLGVRGEEQTLLPPGRYQIAIVPTGKDATGRNVADLSAAASGAMSSAFSGQPLWGEWPLPASTLASFNFTGSDKDLSETLDEFEMPDPALDLNIPVIEIPEVEIPEQRPPGERGPRPEGAPSGNGTRRTR